MKKKASYTIDDDVLIKFNQTTKILAVNKSALVQNLINEWLRVESKKKAAIEKWIEIESETSTGEVNE